MRAKPIETRHRPFWQYSVWRNLIPRRPPNNCTKTGSGKGKTRKGRMKENEELQPWLVGQNVGSSLKKRKPCF